MSLTEAFQVYKTTISEPFQFIDGRLLNDINITDKFVLVKNIDNKEILAYVRIKEILSYGMSWKCLNAGMTARIKCEYTIKLMKNSILYKIIE